MRPAGGSDATTSAVGGGVVAVLTSFVPLSPVLGGAAAGYLRSRGRSAGTRVAVAGLVAALPVVVRFGFLVGGFLVVASELALGAVTGIIVLALLFSLVVAVFYTVGLSALGGYLGSGLASPAADPDAEYGREPSA